MTVEVASFNAAGLLPAGLEAEIRAGIDGGIAALRRHVDVEDAGIVVLLTEGVDPETGMGGLAYGPDACEIRVEEASRALRRGLAPTGRPAAHDATRDPPPPVMVGASPAWPWTDRIATSSNSAP